MPHRELRRGDVQPFLSVCAGLYAALVRNFQSQPRRYHQETVRRADAHARTARCAPGNAVQRSQVVASGKDETVRVRLQDVLAFLDQERCRDAAVDRLIRQAEPPTQSQRTQDYAGIGPPSASVSPATESSRRMGNGWGVRRRRGLIARSDSLFYSDASRPDDWRQIDAGSSEKFAPCVRTEHPLGVATLTTFPSIAHTHPSLDRTVPASHC